MSVLRRVDRVRIVRLSDPPKEILIMSTRNIAIAALIIAVIVVLILVL